MTPILVGVNMCVIVKITLESYFRRGAIFLTPRVVLAVPATSFAWMSELNNVFFSAKRCWGYRYKSFF